MFAVTVVHAFVTLLFAAVYIALRIHLRATQDPREPPLIEKNIPYISPLWGLLDNNYFTKLRKRYHNGPIYTLRILGGQKIYVVNDPHLIAAVQRQPKTLTFQAIEDSFAKNVCNLSPATLAITAREAHKWLQLPGAPSPSHIIFQALNPGNDLEKLNRTMAHALQQSCRSWVPDGKASTKFGLFFWVQEVIAIASTAAVYGPENPYSSAAMRKHFWTFNAGLGVMALGAGNLFAKDSVKSLRTMADEFEEYFSKDRHHQASGLTRQRYEWYMSRGYPLRDLATLEVANGIAILTNTVPTAFWVVLHIFSDPQALDACRTEVFQQVVDTKDSEGSLLRTLDIRALKTSCPVLQSAFKEAMRIHSKAVGMRGVVQEHLLDGKYLLQKDALVFMPATVQHFDSESWGADTAEYCHDRFTDKTRPRVSKSSFRAFGGGTTLCPGRHFAMIEILMFAALLLLKFDIKPTSAKWVVPEMEQAGLTKLVPGPASDIEVELTRRADDEGVKWVWQLSENEDDDISELGDDGVEDEERIES